MIYKSYYLVLSFLSLLLLLPIIGIISKIEFEISYLFEFFGSKYNTRIIYISFLQAFLSAFFSCFIAVPFAFSLYRNKHLKIVKFVISLCGYSFVIPSILIVHSVIGIYGTNGFLNNIGIIIFSTNLEQFFSNQWNKLHSELFSHIL